VRIGARFNFNCNNIVTSKGVELSWSDTIRYLGVGLYMYPVGHSYAHVVTLSCQHIALLISLFICTSAEEQNNTQQTDGHFSVK